MMQQWLNLLVQFATPVFKTLVYAGTSNFLRALEEELKENQKEQVNLLVSSWGIGQWAREKKELEEFMEIGYQKASEIQEAIADIAGSIDIKKLDFQQQRFQAEKVLQQQLLAERRQSLSDLAAYQRETALLLPEVQKTLEHWPLKLLPSQILTPETASGPPALRLLLAPPQIPLADGAADLTAMERQLTQTVREFVSQNYSWHCAQRPVEFLGGVWESKQFHGEASIKALFSVLQSEPTLILESEIEGETLVLRMAYWGLAQEKYCYETIFKLPYREFLQESAKSRACQWRQVQDQLLALGKDRAAIARLGGSRVRNLAVLEEAEQLHSAGIPLAGLTLTYETDREDGENLCQFLATCHCLVAGWVADIHYLIHEDAPPILPGLLGQLVGQVAEQPLLPNIVRTTAGIYQEVVRSLAKERPYWLPELALKLAHSLAQLPDKSLAREQVNYSLKIWLQQRQLSPLKGLKALASDPSPLTAQDRDYLGSLQACLSALGDEPGSVRVQQILGEIPASQSPTPSFILSHTLPETVSPVTAVAISPKGDRLVNCLHHGPTPGGCHTLEMWELSPLNGLTKNQLKSLRYSAAAGVFTFTLSPDGQTLASSDRAGDRSHLKIWHLPTGKLQRTLFGHKKQIRALAMGQDGRVLASASHKLKLWDLTTGEPCQTLFGHKQWVNALAMNGQVLVSGSDDRSVRLWNWQGEELLVTFNGHKGAVRALALSPDGSLLASGADDRQIFLWDLTAGRQLGVLAAHGAAVWALAISPDGEYLFSGSADRTIRVWHLPSLTLLQTLTGHSASVRSLALSADGRLLVSGSEDRTVRIWQAAGVRS